MEQEYGCYSHFLVFYTLIHLVLHFYATDTLGEILGNGIYAYSIPQHFAEATIAASSFNPLVGSDSHLVEGWVLKSHSSRYSWK